MAMTTLGQSARSNCRVLSFVDQRVKPASFKSEMSWRILRGTAGGE